MTLYMTVIALIAVFLLTIELVLRLTGERWINVRIGDADGSSRIVRINVGRDKEVDDLLKRARCNSCVNGHNGRHGNGYQPCGCSNDKRPVDMTVTGIGDQTIIDDMIKKNWD